MDKISLNLKCPKCGLPARAQLEESYRKFIIYTCPKCRSNVAYYDNRIDIISNQLLRDLIKKKQLRYCGDVLFMSNQLKELPLLESNPCSEVITKDMITDLKILLNTEEDFDNILSQL